MVKLQGDSIYLSMERITANTLEINISASKSLERLGFALEGRERKAVYFGGKQCDKLNYGLLAEEYRGENGK